MADQVTANQPPVETPAVVNQKLSAEEKKQYVIAKVKEIFEKENFKKNYSNLFDHIYDHQMNSIPLPYILSELKVIEKGIDEKTITEALKSENLKESIVYLEKQLLIHPTWRRLRNILYIKTDKAISSQIKTYLQENITIPGVVMTIEIIQEESVKITVTSPEKEEEHTKLIFSQLFQKTIKLADGKEFTFNCVIEEEQFPLPANFSSNKQFKSHSFIPSQSQMTQQFYLQQQFLFQMALQNQMYQNQNQKVYSKKGPREQRGSQPQGAGAYSTRNGGVSAPVSNDATSGNDLQKSTHNGQQNHHQGNNYQQSRGGQNNTGNRNNKPRRDGGKPFVKGPGGKQSQKSFNATENDFPTLA